MREREPSSHGELAACDKPVAGSRGPRVYNFATYGGADGARGASLQGSSDNSPHPRIDGLVSSRCGGGPRLSEALFQSTVIPKGMYSILSVSPTLECLPAPSPGLRQSKTWILIYQAIE